MSEGGPCRARCPRSGLRGVAVVRDGRPILDEIDWDVGSGERWAVLGPNGSGKTTLLHVAGMRLLPTRGTVEVLGARYGRVRRAGTAHPGGVRQPGDPSEPAAHTQCP